MTEWQVGKQSVIIQHDDLFHLNIFKQFQHREREGTGVHYVDLIYQNGPKHKVKWLIHVT